MSIPNWVEVPDTAGLFVGDVEDPTGGGEATKAIGYKDEHGVIHNSGIYLGVHGGGPLPLRFLRGNPSTNAAEVFDIDPGDGRAVIAEL